MKSSSGGCLGFRSYKDRKRILVTGGSGFVGSHLVDRLMMDGHEVTAVLTSANPLPISNVFLELDLG
jgi:nucleoside-diphosphate-sugar epimerase